MSTTTQMEQANPYRTPSAELPSSRPAGSTFVRFLFALFIGTISGAASGGLTGWSLTMGWRQMSSQWALGLSAGLLLGAIGGFLVGAVLGLVAQTSASSRAVSIVGGVLGAIWAAFFGGLGAIPMETTTLIALGAVMSGSVGGLVGVLLARYLGRRIGPDRTD